MEKRNVSKIVPMFGSYNLRTAGFPAKNIRLSPGAIAAIPKSSNRFAC
jgi:hypothetical protein